MSLKCDYLIIDKLEIGICKLKADIFDSEREHFDALIFTTSEHCRFHSTKYTSHNVGYNACKAAKLNENN